MFKISLKTRLVFSRLKRKILKHIWFLRGMIIGSFLIVFYLLVVFTGNVIKKTEVGFYLGLARDFVFRPMSKIKSFDGRTNLLILGKGGKGHEAPDLTDTIIFVSVQHNKPSLALISIPRDIWLPDLRTKLNSVYYWGNQRQKNGGLLLAKATVEEIVGQPIHYGIVVDFSGFKEIINALGGIEVNVERDFVDKKYPIEGKENDLCGGDPEFKCRYETVVFNAGLQFMDGEKALKFVRSRNAEGEEGTDFARAARQQKVIMAIKKKVLSRQILLSPKKILGLKEIILQMVETDLNPSSAAILARLIFETGDRISSQVLPENLLVNPPESPKYDNLYVFIPKNENWDEIHRWVNCFLNEGECS